MSAEPVYEAPFCPDCRVRARLVTGRTIYPHREDLAGKWLYRCDCGNYCGCHGATKRPLGTPAGPELRKARQLLHERIDPLWQNAWSAYGQTGQPTNVKAIQGKARTRIYEFLAHKLGLEREECHTAMFSIEQCRAAWVALRGVTYGEIREWSKVQKGEQV